MMLYMKINKNVDNKKKRKMQCAANYMIITSY